MDEGRRLVRGALGFASATLLSRVLGFVRDIIVASFFGASHAADAFFIAFSIPSLLRRLFAEGSLSAAFVSVLSRTEQQQGQARANQVFQRVFSLLGLVLLLVSSLGMLAAPLLVFVMVPGFGAVPGKHELTVELTRIMFPYLFFIGLATAFMGALNVRGRFFLSSLTPAVLNIAIIAACAVGWYWYDADVRVLAWGVVAGGAAQMLMQLPAVISQGFRPQWNFSTQDPDVRRVVQLMIPGIFGLAVAQINTTVDGIVASYLAAGSVSFLYYANRLIQFPLGVFGIAISTAILPGLSRAAGREDPVELRALMQRGFELICFITVPCALGLGLAGGPIVEMLFVNGAFTSADARATAFALAAYAFGLLAFALVKMLVSVYYAHQDSRTPVRAAVWALVVNAALNVALMFPLQHVGLALATSVASWVNFAYLWMRLDAADRPGRVISGEMGRIIALNLSLGALLAVWIWFSSALALGATLESLLAIVGALIWYLAGAWILRLDSLRYLRQNLRRTAASPVD